MYFKVALIFDCFVVILLMSDAIVLACIALLGTFITAGASIWNTILSRRMLTKQDKIQEQTDGKMNELLAMSTGKSAADATVKVKDELIEVLKQTAPLDGSISDHPTEVIITNPDPIPVTPVEPKK